MPIEQLSCKTVRSCRFDNCIGLDVVLPCAILAQEHTLLIAHPPTTWGHKGATFNALGADRLAKQPVGNKALI